MTATGCTTKGLVEGPLSFCLVPREREQLKAGAYRIQGTSIEAEVRRLTGAIGSARTKRRNIISQEFRDEYFRRRPTEDIERHNNGQHDEEYIEPVVEHQIPQRTQLVDLICARATDITPQNAVKRRIQVAELMLALCKCREAPSRYRLRVGIPPSTRAAQKFPQGLCVISGACKYLEKMHVQYILYSYY
ncbi:hypothetical protein VC83_04818 [Pseudogymnoascus destructans]|uniref:Uncharacterized protein n=1 Tax=Pseudogymnoascus destructans TaxID=655981 RepID=A0A177A6G5_9PEZI|nr:uncharacterized protein VC83_04818 [Pseudogymnoascus destructans]OAF57260.1 hypothetical protein VC83_04818 [Pseudogymnoascus destructans]